MKILVSFQVGAHGGIGYQDNQITCIRGIGFGIPLLNQTNPKPSKKVVKGQECNDYANKHHHHHPITQHMPLQNHTYAYKTEVTAHQFSSLSTIFHHPKIRFFPMHALVSTICSYPTHLRQLWNPLLTTIDTYSCKLNASLSMRLYILDSHQWRMPNDPSTSTFLSPTSFTCPSLFCTYIHIHMYIWYTIINTLKALK